MVAQGQSRIEGKAEFTKHMIRIRHADQVETRPEANEIELVPPERALEVSLAENSGPESLHPADEFEAVKALIDEGKGVKDVAARYPAPLTATVRQQSPPRKQKSQQALTC